MNSKDVAYFNSALPGMINGGSLFVQVLPVKYKGNSTRTTVLGVSKAHFEIFSIALESGRFFPEEDISFRNPVCIIGPDIAANLFKDIDSIGKTIQIEEKNFTVIGLTERQTQGFINDGSDKNTIFVHQDFIATKIFRGRNYKYWVYIMKFDILENVDLAKERTGSYLNNKYGMLREEPRFRIEHMDTYIGMTDRILNIVSILILVMLLYQLLSADWE